MARIRLLDRLCLLHPEREREELLAHVLCGDVSVEGERVRDPRRLVRADSSVCVDASPTRSGRYVGRGGVKLEHALREWGLSVRGDVVLDAGASTGGFTDCLLQHGARVVHSVDVGYNQLDYRLRTDRRVIVHERTNIMHVHSLDPAPVAAVADLSFRSLRGAAGHLLALAPRWAVLLVKPQFEWESAPKSFDGTVPDTALAGILIRTLSALAVEGAIPQALLESPIRGRKGNREYLLLARSARSPDSADRPIDELVARATARTTS